MGIVVLIVLALLFPPFGALLVGIALIVGIYAAIDKLIYWLFSGRKEDNSPADEFYVPMFVPEEWNTRSR